MDAIEIALAGSILANVLLVWKLIDAAYSNAIARKNADYWRDSAHHWCKQFDDLRRNSVQRDPRTGRYVKGYRRHD